MSRWVAAVLVLFAVGCSEEPPPPPEVERPVKILVIGADTADVRREFPGTITSEAEAEFGFEVAGRVIEFPVEEGQQVEPGTLMARLDDRDFLTRLEKATALMENKRADYDRAQTLFQEGALAEAERDRRQTSYRVTEADTREARKAVEDATLKAPVPGTIARKLVRVGESVQAKQAILIFQADAGGGMEIEVAVPEREIAAGTPGRSTDEITEQVDPKVILSSIPDRPIPARVTEFATSADPATRTFQITLSFDPPPDLQVLPGMTAKVSVRALRAGQGGDLGVALPTHAVAADESGDSFVWVVDPATMTVSRRPVELGGLADDSVQIRSGVGEGDWIAVSGVTQLREAMKVSRLER